MDSKERLILANKLWKVLELLQRVNTLVDIDEEDFLANNLRCKIIKEVSHRLNEGDNEALVEARELAAEYQGIFSDEEQ